MRTTTKPGSPITEPATVTRLSSRKSGRPAAEPTFITDEIVEGAHVADYRTLRNMTQDELAHRSGVARSTLALYEKGFKRMPDERVRTIASALGIHVWKIRNIQALSFELKVA